MRRLRLIVCLIALTSLALAPACGGGGGGGGGTTPPPGGGGPVGGAPGSADAIGWLARLNNFRAWAGLPPVTEDVTLQQGGNEHCIYMVRNDVIEHAQDLGVCCKTPAGLYAAMNSNLSVSGGIPGLQAEAPMRGWMTGPFHGVGMIDPRLVQSSFANYYELVGTWHHGAALDTGSHITGPGGGYPIMWPGNGAVIDILSYGGNESPDPLAGSGYAAPTGIPVYLQLGPGGITPAVTASSFSEQGGAPLPHIIFDETSYTNPNGTEQALGRNILGFRDCIVLMAQSPLQAGKTYAVSITANGNPYNWTFSTTAGATKPTVSPQNVRPPAVPAAPARRAVARSKGSTYR